MSALSDSLNGLINTLTEIGNAAKEAQKQTTAITPKTNLDIPPVNPPAPGPVPEKRIAITLNLPRIGRQANLITDETGADQLTQFLTDLRAELERS